MGSLSPPLSFNSQFLPVGAGGFVPLTLDDDARIGSSSAGAADTSAFPHGGSDAAGSGVLAVKASKPRRDYGPTAKRWVFTINNPTSADYQMEAGTYGMYQLEKGEATGTLHLQGFVVFATAQRLSAVKKLNDRAHWSPMRGSIADNEAYCTKDETAVGPPFTRKRWGTPPVGQGSRTDLSAVAALVKEGGLSAVARDMPEMIIRYPAGLQLLEEYCPRAVPVAPPSEWRPWQQSVLAVLAGPADNRTIHWVFDPTGGAGKSTLVKYVIANSTPCTAISLSGQVKDMAYAYREQSAVFFDVARTMAENVNHLAQFAEKLKDGVVFSSKYASRQRVFRAPHVFFFANVAPPAGAWSADRLRLWDLSEGAGPAAFAAASAPPSKSCVTCGKTIFTNFSECSDCM